jgi:hypothetical protein
VGCVVEAIEEHFVFWSQQIEEEPIERRAGGRDLRARHAAARVEDDAEADRDALGAEVRDVYRLIVLEHPEIALLQTGHESSGAVGDRRGDVDEFDAGAKAERILTVKDVRASAGDPDRQREHDAAAEHPGWHGR